MFTKLNMLKFQISVCCFFFFSSRRRHTRFDCDWSSDVCSSDLGLRHKLEMPLVMTEDGRMEHPTRVPKTLADLDRFVAREKVVDLLKERGLLEKVEPHRHAVRHCYRCDSVVEPRLSEDRKSTRLNSS